MSGWMTMDHADTLERIEIAAVEPEGLERLMAGDTPDGAAVAGHLAGCPACTAELARIRRTSELAREAIRSLPDPALRDRTLTFVRVVGRDRSTAALEALPEPAPIPGTTPARAAPLRVVPRDRRWFTALSGLAAAVVIAGVLGFAAAGVVRAPVTDQHLAENAVLSAVAETTLRVEQQADATHLVLASVNGDAAVTGTLLFSPSSGELVMVADGLGPAPAGKEYGGWVAVDGEKRRIGRMYTGGELQAWAGPVDGLAALPPGAVFGVSLVPVGGGAGEPVLTGQL
jgi:hypothetical protein